MENNTKSNISSFILLLLLAIVVIFVMFVSCSPNKMRSKIEIERLFMQTTKPEIDFLSGGGLQGQGGPRTISEEVSFTNMEDQSLEDNEVFASTAAKLDTSKVYKLSEVVIKVRSHFAPERDGKVNLDFNIIAPVDILDPNWRLILTPKLIDGDSICRLDTVVLVGEGFKDKQIGDYEAYEDFLSTIVDPSAYDSLFVNWKSLYKEIHKVQRRNFNDYRNQYELIRGYEDWKKMNEMEFLSMEALAMRHKKHMYSKYWRKAENQTIKNKEKGKNSDGLHEKYDAKYKKDYASFLKNMFSLHWLDSVNVDVNLHVQKDSILKRSHVPRKYREIHTKKLTLKDIQAKAFTAEDSARIAKHHYMIDEIVLNELNMNRKDDIFKEIVEFPYRSSRAGLKIDTVITAEDDIIYHYRQPWAVKPGMKNLKIVLESRAEAIDRSVFAFPTSDTLTYFIASLSQLADESLVTERKKLHKYLFDKGTVYPNYKTRKAHQFDESINQGTFDKLLEAYNTYTSKSEYSVDSIIIHNSVDLLGDWQSNHEQSQRRGDAISAYLRSKTGAPVVVKNKGEDWSSLVKEIQQRNDLPNATAILDSLTTAVYPDKTEEAIKKLYPNDYKIIHDEIYPKLNRIDYYIELCRTDIEKDTIRETYREDYAEAVRLLRNGEYMDAIEILASYGDYNTALCLVCMGYNDKALSVLDRLPESPKNEYLSAIIFARKKDDKEAAKRLINACKLDPDLHNRIKLDSEVSELADRINLWPRLSKY
ncbi:tetratricopeptide repeat protein [Dysgonomonas sp.]